MINKTVEEVVAKKKLEEQRENERKKRVADLEAFKENTQRNLRT